MRRIVFESILSPENMDTPGTAGVPYPFALYDELALPHYTDRYDTYLFGRKTYEAVTRAAYRCAGQSPEGRQFFCTFFTLRKYVFTRGEYHVIGNGMVIRQNMAAEIRRIRGEEGKDILLCGGSKMLASLSALDLIDEYVFFIHPLLWFDWRRASTRQAGATGFHLVGDCILPSGITMLRYRSGRLAGKEGYYDRSIQNQCPSSE